MPQIQEVSLYRTTWIRGYWQSPRYFVEHAAQIRAELMPPPAVQPNFVAISELIKKTDSVALGVRLYEESKDPTSYARDGRLKSVDQIREAIARLRTSRPYARFFVFCTHRSAILQELRLPEDTVFLTRDDGYTDTIETLWLMSQCRHHLFTNSSFFWWGAWLSGAVHATQQQTILAADNFYHSDGLCSEWEKF
jgi:hypothetical protein